MSRIAVRAALGIATLSIASFIAPSLASAQVAPGVTRDAKSTRDDRLIRGFDRIFERKAPAPTPRWTSPGMINEFELENGVRLPTVTVAPQPHGTPLPAPDCVMRVIPVDPKNTSRMPTVNVDERADPKFIVTVPPCQPRD